MFSLHVVWSKANTRIYSAPNFLNAAQHKTHRTTESGDSNSTVGNAGNLNKSENTPTRRWKKCIWYWVQNKTLDATEDHMSVPRSSLSIKVYQGCFSVVAPEICTSHPHHTHLRVQISLTLCVCVHHCIAIVKHPWALEKHYITDWYWSVIWINLI